MFKLVNLDILHWIVKVNLIHDFTIEGSIDWTRAFVESDVEDNDIKVECSTEEQNYNKLQVTLNIYSVNTNLFRSFTHSSVNIGQLERDWNLTMNNLNLLY